MEFTGRLQFFPEGVDPISFQMDFDEAREVYDFTSGLFVER